MSKEQELNEAVKAFKRAYNARVEYDNRVVKAKGATLMIVDRERATRDVVTIPADGYFHGSRIA
jgi:hypothetical protein